MPRSRFAGSYGDSIFGFSINVHTVLHSSCTNLHSLFSTSSLEYILCKFFDDEFSDWYEVIPHCSLTSISLIITDVEHLHVPLAFSLSSFSDKGLFKSSSHFLFIYFFGLFFWYEAVWEFYIFWRLSPYWLLHLQTFLPILCVLTFMVILLCKIF